MYNIFEKFDYYRREKKIRIETLIDNGISKSKYHRLQRGEAKLNLEDSLVLSQALNLSPFEVESIYYAKVSTDTLSENIYESYDIISVHGLLLYAYEVASIYPLESKKIFTTLKANRYIKSFFPLTLALISLMENDLAEESDEKEVDDLYQEVMARDVWTSYEVTLIFSFLEMKSFDDIRLLEGLANVLWDRTIIAPDDYYTLQVVMTLYQSLFIKSVIKRDTSRIKRFYREADEVRHNNMTILIAFTQRQMEISYLELTGRQQEAASNLDELKRIAKFLLDYHAAEQRNESFVQIEYDKMHAEIVEWRKELGVSEDYNLLNT
ncbi:hypothetical protein Hs30E_13800 [Lactococcus hodotermopsidis]|uniref:Transcriptional regulator n=1 Tax=Pseudolactococcus hodotermopsidis TaxID=2709157 RepID=A0A6A0BBK8_9LACT|nr:hypothetical protein [Lactococcus hodotermopsidis]GFH42829.1 hypothetical protein Hs30E_13800 [Lactococcus hodotermopsidis]